MRSAAASSTVPREGHICPLYWAILKLRACVSWYAKDILLLGHIRRRMGRVLRRVLGGERAAVGARGAEGHVEG